MALETSLEQFHVGANCQEGPLNVSAIMAARLFVSIIINCTLT